MILGPPRINLEKSSFSQLYSYIDNPTPVTIICYWWGYPIPALSIKKNNKALPSEDVKIDGRRLEATVKIDSEDDFGNYTCHASNRFGDATYDLSIMKAGKWYCPVGREGWGILSFESHFSRLARSFAVASVFEYYIIFSIQSKKVSALRRYQSNLTQVIVRQRRFLIFLSSAYRVEIRLQVSHVQSGFWI